MHILTVAKREVKLGFRNAWTYTFLILLVLFTIANFLMQAGIQADDGYNDMTGTMINLSLYLLPLITLLLGGFSTTTEKEDGQWSLLSTYPISVHQFLWGKWLGLAFILVVILAFSFGFAGFIAFLFGRGFTIEMFLFFLLFSVMLSFVYLSVAFLLGAIARNRWQSLIASIIIWFITIVMWPLLMISTLSHLPSYKLIQPMLIVATILNPAEFIRIYSIVKIGAGSIFGAEYNAWITRITSSDGLFVFLGIFIIWMLVPVIIGSLIWSRGEANGEM